MMKIKKIKFIIFASVLGVVIVFLIYLLAKEEISNNYIKNGGFSRKIKNLDLTLVESFKLNGNYNFIGHHKSNIYLFNLENNDIIKLSESMPNLENKKNSFRNLEISSIQLDSAKNEILIFCGNQKQIIKLDVFSMQIKEILKTKHIFSNGARVKNKFLLVDQKPNTFNNQLTMYIEKGNELFKKTNIDIFKDNAMVDDGMLKADKNGFFVFVHYYKNKILILDSTAKLIKTINTIDTISQGPKTTLIDNRRLVYNAPPRLTNKDFFITENGNLAVESLVKSDKNEELQKSSIIDIYNKDYGYFYSLIIEAEIDKAPKSTYITQARIYVITSKKLLIYQRE